MTRVADLTDSQFAAIERRWEAQQERRPGGPAWDDEDEWYMVMLDEEDET